MAEDLVHLIGEGLGTAIAQDPTIVTTDELQDVLSLQELLTGEEEEEEGVTEHSSDADAATNINSDVEDRILITEQDEEDQLSWGSVSLFCAKCGINLVLPFINGMMLGFGEILAHELGFKYGWIGARVYPQHRMVANQRLKSQYL